MFSATHVSKASKVKKYATIDPTTASSVVSFFNNNLAIQTSMYGCAVSTIGKSSGKWYFEVRCIDSSQKATLFGVVDFSKFNKNTYPSAPNNGWCYYFYNGNTYFDDIGASYAPSPNYNEWVGCYFDASAKTIGFISNGINRGIAYSGLTGTLRAIIGSGSSASSGLQDANFGASPFVFTPPAGYNLGLYE